MYLIQRLNSFPRKGSRSETRFETHKGITTRTIDLTMKPKGLSDQFSVAEGKLAVVSLIEIRRGIKEGIRVDFFFPNV